MWEKEGNIEYMETHKCTQPNGEPREGVLEEKCWMKNRITELCYSTDFFP